MSHPFDLFHLGGTALRPALHHLGWPWLGAPPPSMTTLVGVKKKNLQVQLTIMAAGLAFLFPTQLTTIEVGPGLGLLLFFSIFSSFSSSLAAPAAGIQSDSDPK